MNATSDVIKEAPIFTDDGVTDDNAHLFPELLNEIDRKPDAARRPNQAYAAVKRIAEAEVVEDKRADWQKRMLSDAEANNLAEDLFGVTGTMPGSKEADELVAVVMRIVDLYTYEDNAGTRESNTTFLSLALYWRTKDCCHRMEEFARDAGVEAA